MPPPRPVYTSRIFQLSFPSTKEQFEVTVSDTQLAFVDAAHLTTRRTLTKRAVNRIATLFVSGFSHVEFAFLLQIRSGPRLGEQFYFSCGIAYGDTVSMERKRYDQRHYQMHRLGATPHQCDTLFALCQRDLVRPTPFNARGFWLNFVLPHSMRIDRGGAAVFCSEHVLRTLREARIDTFAAGGLEPYETTPQRIFDYLSENNHFDGVIGNIHVRAADLNV